MNRNLLIALLLSVSTSLVSLGQEPTACGTLLESIEAATIDELGTDYRRLQSYGNPYCDTTNSDLHKMMEALAQKLTAAKSNPDAVVAQLGEPYYRGTLSDYENQKVTVGRGGQMLGKALPPQYKIPAGDYYVVYLWREKDYLIFGFSANKASAYKWWEKGNY